MIRRATVQDADALARIAARTFRDAFLSQNDPDDIEQHCRASYRPEIQRAEIEDPACVTLVADLNDDLIAYVQIRLRAPKDVVDAKRPAELKRLYVSSEWHGRGVAHDLMHATITAVKSVRADALWLGVWEHNARGIAFYRKYGFEAVGHQVFNVGSDPQRDLVMATALKNMERE